MISLVTQNKLQVNCFQTIGRKTFLTQFSSIQHFTDKLHLKMSFCSWSRQEIYRNEFSSGIYCCSQCGYPLFSSTEKYKHHTPWPAFTNPIHKDSLTKKIEDEEQESSDAVAYKVLCGKCGNPLGHEFLKDGPGGIGSRF